MISFMQSVFGTYSPVTSETGEMLTNWEYVGSVAIFCLFLYCVARIIGAMLGKR